VNLGVVDHRLGLVVLDLGESLHRLGLAVAIEVEDGRVVAVAAIGAGVEPPGDEVTGLHADLEPEVERLFGCGFEGLDGSVRREGGAGHETDDPQGEQPGLHRGSPGRWCGRGGGMPSKPATARGVIQSRARTCIRVLRALQ